MTLTGRRIAGWLLLVLWIGVGLVSVPYLIECQQTGTGNQAIGLTNPAPDSGCGAVPWIVVALLVLAVLSIIWLDAPLRRAFGGPPRHPT
ncbi:MAG TPA: hypothetical protein VN842_01230 [Thermoplasmata archaeon]|nr:hypothetical protein [Thermoplasmata archaeon]